MFESQDATLLIPCPLFDWGMNWTGGQSLHIAPLIYSD